MKNLEYVCNTCHIYSLYIILCIYSIYVIPYILRIFIIRGLDHMGKIVLGGGTSEVSYEAETKCVCTCVFLYLRENLHIFKIQDVY